MRHYVSKYLCGDLSRLDDEVDFETVTRRYREAAHGLSRYRASSSRRSAQPILDLRPLWIEYQRQANKGCRHWKFHGLADDKSSTLTVTEGYLAILGDEPCASIIISCEPKLTHITGLKNGMRRKSGFNVEDAFYAYKDVFEDPKSKPIPWLFSAIAAKMFVEPVIESRVFKLRQERIYQKNLETVFEPEKSIDLSC